MRAAPWVVLAAGWALAALATTVSTTWGADAGKALDAMLRRVVTAPEVTTHVLLERSDPFGGPPRRERGRIWYLPEHGLRYRSDQKDGQDLVIDRGRDAFLLYSALDQVVYRGTFDRAPLHLRRLIAEPERFLDEDLLSIPERRVIHGTERAGYRIWSRSRGDSLQNGATWISADPRTGLPRWIAITSQAESVLVELEGLAIRSTARPGDLLISAPKGTPEEPLDPRELLGGEDRGESR